MVSKCTPVFRNAARVALYAPRPLGRAILELFCAEFTLALLAHARVDGLAIVEVLDLLDRHEIKSHAHLRLLVVVEEPS